MKEMYKAPECELFALAADEKLATSEFDFDDILDGVHSGVSCIPEVDIDVPIEG